MAKKREKRQEPPDERLLFSFFKMTGVINLYLAGNPRLFTLIDMFREAVEEIRAEAGDVSLRFQNGRFYLNSQLFSYSPAMVGPMSKLTDYFQARRVQGFRFHELEQVKDIQIVNFVDLLNRAERSKDPFAWIQTELQHEKFGWVEPLLDQDFVPGGEGDGENATGGGGANGKVHTQALATSAREAYSQALTAMLSTMGKLPAQKRVSLQQTKRVIQNMIDILVEDEGIMLGLGTIRDYDDYTYTHSVNVAILSMCLGKRLGLSRALIEQLGLCGLFHDLGKVDIPVELIAKADILTPDEYEEVKRHPIYSIRQIMRFSTDHAMKAKFLLAPLEHHLGIDLSGYPQTGRKEPQSLLSRILSIADHYDALTSSRSYRPVPFSPDMALRIMVEVSGTKLDPILLKVFIDLVGVYPVGSFVLLDTGELGIVSEVPENSEQGRPFVVLLRRNGDDFVSGLHVDLSERNADGSGFKRNIERCFHPSEYGIQPANYLV